MILLWFSCSATCVSSVLERIHLKAPCRPQDQLNHELSGSNVLHWPAASLFQAAQAVPRGTRSIASSPDPSDSEIEDAEAL